MPHQELSTFPKQAHDPHCDLLLVGDSLGMVLYGFDNTLPVTLEMMIRHSAAVMRGSQQACVIGDLPFGSYQESPRKAFHSAARVMAETGCTGVKLEGGMEMAETIAFLVARGVPVLGHIGLKPQAVHGQGGFRVDAEPIERAGAFATVLEETVEPLARQVAERLNIPIISIGAFPACDGQILVTDDMLGLFADFTPSFVRRYADFGLAISGAGTLLQCEADSRQTERPEQFACLRLRL